MLKTKCILENGEISNNVSTDNAGGGIRADSDALLIMNGGIVKENSANIGGGGIDYNTGRFQYNSGIVENNQSNNASNLEYPNADIYPDMKYDIDWTKDETLNLKKINIELIKSFVRGEDIVDRATQGMTRTDKYILFTSWKTNKDNTIINVVDRKTLEVLNSIEEYYFNHANGMTYNPKTGDIYSLTSTSKIAKFNLDENYEITNLSYLDFPRTYSGIVYDKDNDYYIALSLGVCYVMDSEFNELYSFNLRRELTSQGLAYYNGHIYHICFELGNNSTYQKLCFNNKERLSSLIYQYDMNGNLQKTFYIPREHVTGEIENGYFCENGDLVLSYNIKLNGKETVSFYKCDVINPNTEVEYSETKQTNKNVTVTIVANEEIQEVEGWTISEDKKTLTKTYQNNTEETVQVKDIAGNTTNTEISINNIDKQNPVIEGLENGKLYKDSVIATTTDQNLGTLILEKDGEKVEGYTNGKEITEEGTYKLTATDKAGNSTEVSFTIQYERGELNKNNQIDIGDILLLLRHIAQANSEKVLQKHPQWKLENKDVIIGDINRNNKIDIGDVLKLQRYMAAKANKGVADKHPDWLNIE